MSQKSDDVRIQYHGKECKVVLGPPCFVEQRNGALMGSGMPTIHLADPNTGELRRGLTVEIPEAPLKPGQVLVGGKAEGLRALIAVGVVRFTGDYYRSKKFDAPFAVCDLLMDSLGDPKLSLEDLGRLAAEGKGGSKAKERHKNRDVELDR